MDESPRGSSSSWSPSRVACRSTSARTESESGLKKYWLRLTKRGESYEFAWSADGKKWNASGERAWGDGKPKQIGLIAKNGGNKDAPEVDAAFEFFELRGPEKPAKK